MRVFCKKCNYQLTFKELERIPNEELCYQDLEELVPPGKYALAKDSDFRFEKDIEYLFNEFDLDLQKYEDLKRFQGCCGPGDLNVLNQICPQCKTELGVYVADCIYPTFIGLVSKLISKKAIW